VNKPQMFSFNNATVRIVDKNGQPWFVLKDVCDVLEIGNPSDVKARLDNGVVSIEGIPDSLGRTQQATIINEDGLYDVILESRKQEARAFRKWVTSEVLPSIRKTGQYNSIPQMTTTEIIAAIANQAVEQEKRVSVLEARITETTETMEAIQETFLQRDEDWRKSINSMLNGAAFRLTLEHRDIRNRSYELLDERAHSDLKTRLRNMIKRLENVGATKTQIKNANKLDVIENDPHLKEIYTTIVKEISIGSLRIAR